MVIDQRLLPTLPDEESTKAFRDCLRGEIIIPDDPHYADACSIFNVMIKRRPALIARCTGVADVITALGFARDQDLLVAIRSGGHHVAGNSICDDGLVIDLSAMKGVWIDPTEHTVRAQAGLTCGELNRELQVHSLGATGGYISITGLPGLTLGGGFGWLLRKHGLALDNLRSVEIVTADGQVRTASATEHEDLLWAIRGGGGSFGVVTSFEFAVHPVGTVLAGPLIYPLEQAPEVLRFYREFSATAPDELTSGVLLCSLPPAPFIPAEAHGMRVVGIPVCYAGSLEEGERVLQPLREFGPPLADFVQALPFDVAQLSADLPWPPGHHQYWKSGFLTGLGDAAVETMLHHFADVPSSLAVIVIDHLGGAFSRVAPDATAFPHRAWPYNMLISSAWADGTESETNIQWTRELYQAMAPYRAPAIYANYAYLTDESGQRAAEVYGSHTDRLAAIKAKYDPTNLFRMGQSVPTTAG